MTDRLGVPERVLWFSGLMLLAALLPSLAFASLPDPTKCTIQGLLGPQEGEPETKVALIAPGNLAGTHLTITVRNAAGNTIRGALVEVQFSQEISTCGHA